MIMLIYLNPEEITSSCYKLLKRTLSAVKVSLILTVSRKLIMTNAIIVV